MLVEVHMDRIYSKRDGVCIVRVVPEQLVLRSLGYSYISGTSRRGTEHARTALGIKLRCRPTHEVACLQRARTFGAHFTAVGLVPSRNTDET